MIIIRFFQILLILVCSNFHLIAQAKVLLIEDEVDGLQIKLDMIRHAQHEVSIAYYAIYEDESGYRVLAAAVEAARRGVVVRIMVESLASKLSKPLLEYLCRENISVQFFNKFYWKKFYRNIHSLHDKLLIVDDQYYLTGGRNITNNYYSNLYPSKKKFTDIEILVEGESVDQATKYFDHLWNVPFASFLNDNKSKRNQSKIEKIKIKFDSIIQHDLRNDLRRWTDLSVIVAKASFIRDYYDQFPRTRFVTNKMMSLIYEANHTIKAESPYSAPPRLMRRALRSASQKGTKIRIVSNAAFVTDVLVAAAVFDLDRKKYLKWNIRTYEYEGPKTLHSKAMVIDDYISVIGTYNLDNLSYRFNSETITVIEDKAFAAKVSRILDERILLSKPVFTIDNPKSTRNLNWKQKINYAFLKKTSIFSRPFL